MRPVPGGGAITYTLTPPTDSCSHCHCASCRRASGAAFLTWASVPRAQFTLLRGAAALRWHRSSPDVRWGFCGGCGSTLLYESDTPEEAGRVYVTVGSLDGSLDRLPSSHVSFEEHAAWFEPGDVLPRHVGKTDARVPARAPLVVLFVADQAASARFYTSVLGVAPILDVPGMTEPCPAAAAWA